MPAVKPRVLHVDTERGWRGGERQVLWLARALAARGVASGVVARRAEPLASAASEAGLPVHAVAPLFAFDPLTVLAIRRAAREQHADIVHAHSSHAHSAAALATAGQATRLVVTRHIDFAPAASAFTRWKYRQAGAVIAISRRVRDVVTAFGVPAERISLIPNGVDLSRVMTPLTPAELEALGVAGGMPLVVMVAALVGHKAPLTFVRAVAAAAGAGAEFQAVLAGDGYLMADVRAEVRRLKLERTLHLAGWVKYADRLIAAADLFVLSSEEEGFGSVLLDAMQCGKPVAATRAGGIPDVVVDGRTGLLVPVNDPAALGGAIARLCADPALRARLGEAGRLRAGEFAIEGIAEQTEAVYQRVLSGHPS